MTKKSKKTKVVRISLKQTEFDNILSFSTFHRVSLSRVFRESLEDYYVKHGATKTGSLWTVADRSTITERSLEPILVSAVDSNPTALVEAIDRLVEVAVTHYGLPAYAKTVARFWFLTDVVRTLKDNRRLQVKAGVQTTVAPREHAESSARSAVYKEALNLSGTRYE
jgi:hypothetical protein